jgi:hypothetical protein
MPTSLRSTLSALAAKFANDVLAAIRGASIEDLLVENARAPRRGPRRAPAAAAATKVTATASRASATKARFVGGRLARRSPADIEKTLAHVVAALKAGPMRSEQIQKALKLDKREMPRVLALGLKKKLIRRKGQKRATQYMT